MKRSYTPELALDILGRLTAYADSSRADFNRTRQGTWCGVDLRGLIEDGDRKSAEPMAARSSHIGVADRARAEIAAAGFAPHNHPLRGYRRP
jgi:hypothetical protein